MALKDLLQELASLTPEEKAALKTLIGGEEPKTEKRNPIPPELARAKPVYFFTDKFGRVQAHNQRSASKIFYTKRDCQYLGWSTGEIWKKERDAGKTVAEAQKAEYDFMLAHGMRTPPPDLRNTNLGKASSFGHLKALENVAKGGKDLEYQTALKNYESKTGTENLD